MAPKQTFPTAKYEYVVTAEGPKILPVPDQESKDEESPADYNAGGYLPVKLNDCFKDGRYRVVRKLGWGHFSTVWLVKDSHENRHSALKVVKSAGRYAETARDEIKLLSKLALANPCHPGRSHIVSFLDSFTHSPATSHLRQTFASQDSHVCIVFEPLGENLLALIERYKKKGVPCGLVKVIAKQVLLGLQYIHDECDLVHTDIKPENILISIPDVESHINTELSSSPSPTSRNVGVPLPSRAPQSQLRNNRRERHVQIFDSQPLSSPRSSEIFTSKSFDGFRKLQMSSVTKVTTGSLNSTNPLENKNKIMTCSPPSSSSSSSSSSSLAESVRIATHAVSSNISTPPTSLGSIDGVAQITLSSSVHPKDRKSLLALPHLTKTFGSYSAGSLDKGKGKEELDSISKIQSALAAALSSSIRDPPAPALPSAGPSLLTQTAPKSVGTKSHSSSPHSTIELISPLPCYSPPPSNSDVNPPVPISIKIADLGNATPSRVHYTEDIQTRQYRAPEAILGRKDWGTRADIWSVACVVFELLTGEYLFDPQGQGELFTKDDDHMAQIIELLGDFPLEAKMGGRYSRELFDHTGALRYIRTLKPWPLKRVMIEKYLYSESSAESLCQFLEPMLVIDHKGRREARDMFDHEWLNSWVDEEIEEW